MSAQGLKRLQQIAFLFAMETGVCFYGYSGNRSLAVVSPFQLLELLNPSGWDKRKEVCRHLLGKKTSGLRRSRTQAGSEALSVQLGPFSSRRWHAAVLLRGSYLCMSEWVIRLLQHAPPPPLLPQKVNLCSWSGVDDHLPPLTPQVPSGYTGTTRGHFYEQGGKGLEKCNSSGSQNTMGLVHNANLHVETVHAFCFRK